MISGNGQSGVFMLGTDVTNVLVAGNKIGVAATGGAALPNKQAGVWVEGGQGDVIGGGNITLGNEIANNGVADDGPGVEIQSGQGIEVLSNSIHDNTSGGIFISPGSNSPNGTNTIQAPVLTLAQSAAGTTEVAGTLAVDANSGAGQQFTIQFFSNPGSDADGAFEGQTLIGQTTVTAALDGTASFDVRLPVGTAVGANITATVTQPTVLDTSVFSAPLPVTPAPTTNLTITPAFAPSPDPLGTNETYTFTIANVGTNDDPNVVYTGQLDLNSSFISATATLADGSTGTATFSNGTVTANLGTIPAGQSATVTITVSPLDTGTISVTSTAVGTIIDTTPADNTNVVTQVTVNPSASVSLSIDADPNPVPVGSDLVFTVTVINSGPSVATNAVLIDTLPGTVTIQDVNSSQGDIAESTSGGNNILTFNLGDLPVGAATITITVTPNSDGIVTNTAAFTADDSPDALLSKPVSVEKAVNLALTASTPTATGFVGTPLTFNLLVTNDTDPSKGQAPSDATGVVISDQLPGNIDPTQISFSNLSPGASASVSATGLVTITFGTIAANSAGRDGVDHRRAADQRPLRQHGAGPRHGRDQHEHHGDRGDDQGAGQPGQPLRHGRAERRVRGCAGAGADLHGQDERRPVGRGRRRADRPAPGRDPGRRDVLGQPGDGRDGRPADQRQPRHDRQRPLGDAHHHRQADPQRHPDRRRQRGQRRQHRPGQLQQLQHRELGPRQPVRPVHQRRRVDEVADGGRRAQWPLGRS